MKEKLLSNWQLTADYERFDVFQEIYRTLPEYVPYLEIAKETAINLNNEEARQFNEWWRAFYDSGNAS